MKLKAGSLERSVNLNKPPARQRKRDDTNTCIINDRGNITTDSMYIKKILNKYYEYYANKFNNLK